MYAHTVRLIALTLGTLTVVAACASGPYEEASSAAPRSLRVVSAGYTGCRPGDNEISGVRGDDDGNETWYATCAGRTYLCSEVSGDDRATSYSCARAVRSRETEPPEDQ